MKDRAFGRLPALADRHPAATDAIVAAGFVGFGLASLPTVWPASSPVPPLVAVGLVLALFAPLAWRRRYPLATLAAVTAGVALYALSGLPQTPWFGNGWLLAAYSAGAYGVGQRRTPVRAAAAAVFAALLVFEAVARGDAPVGSGPAGERGLGLGLLIAGNLAFVAWVWLFGDAVRAAREREAELAERTRQLEREREANARRAVIDERVRIARELHDVVAHHVSLMGIQAGAARRVLASRPEQAAAALVAIEEASRQAVAEMHRLLGLLRQGADAEPLAPPPNLRQIDALIAQTREAGLPVALAVEGEARPLAPGVELSAYRIVQEALTNALKHAGPARAAVTIRYGERGLDIEVSDDGQGTGAGGGGNGLIGMRERVGLLGGRLQVGPKDGAGFAVRAHLPLEGRSG